MDSERFIRHVERVVAGGLRFEHAERATAATLRTLAECLPAAYARDLAAQLPAEIQRPLVGARTRPPVGSLHEFLRRVADREDVSPSQAYEHARAVLDALTEAVTGHELQHVRTQLPDDMAPLFVAPAAAGWPQTHRHRPHP